MRLIDADELNEYVGREALDTRGKIFALVDRMPTIERPHGEWKTESAIDYLTEIGWLPEHDRILTERPHGNWEYLKEHITEMRDADGELNQKDTCQFILNLMGVIEREGNT